MTKLIYLGLLCGFLAGCSSGGWVVGNGLAEGNREAVKQDCKCAGQKNCACDQQKKK